MKPIKSLCAIIVLIIAFSPQLHAQNTCLDFDGTGDYLQTNLPLANSDFTVELWFRSEDLSSDPSICHPLFHLGFIPNYAVALCGGELIFTDGTIYITANSLTGSTFNDNQWHYLSLVKNGNDVWIYVDCILQEPIIVLVPTGTPNIQDFFLGSYGGLVEWDGAIDECKIFNYPKTQADICNDQYCPLRGTEPGLMLYWNFDEGIANANNTAIPHVDDLSSPSYNGIFNGFALTGSASNYIYSSAQVVYPRAFDFDVLLKDYPTQSSIISLICDGDPLHFGLYDNGSLIPNTTQGLNVFWSFKDPTGPWTSLPMIPYSKYSFGVPRGFINANCSSNINGYVDRLYRAEVKVSNPYGSACLQVSKTAPLRICCPISPFNVSISPNNDVCESASLNLTVCINSPDPYVSTPGTFVTIKWYVNNVYDPALDDLVCFNYTSSSAVTGVLQFEAVITNCGSKSKNAKNSIQVYPKPTCGLIDIWPAGSPYPVQISPDVYVICPGDDTQLGIVMPSGFSNCIPTWQYSFSNAAPWVTLGTSNAVQNTNIVPTASWPSTNIFYRIICQPLSNVCPPCTSNIIELRIKPDPILSTIAGPLKVCKGTNQTLTVNAPQAGQSYTWLCNGAVVGTGTTYNFSATKTACYQLDISNGCYSLPSTLHCVEVCEIDAILSCPEIPNNCACLGLPISLNACASSSSCSPSNLQFKWYVDGVLQSQTGCSFIHTPVAAGNTYKVEITDLLTGCVGSAERTIVPCNKNN